MKSAGNSPTRGLLCVGVGLLLVAGYLCFVMVVSQQQAKAVQHYLTPLPIVGLALTIYGIYSDRRATGEMRSHLSALEEKFVVGRHHYLVTAAELISSAQSRVLSLLSQWHLEEKIFTALETSKAKQVILCGPIMRNAAFPQALLRLRLCEKINREAKERGNGRVISMYSRETYGVKFVIADDHVLVSDKLGSESVGELDTAGLLIRNSPSHAEFFANVYSEILREDAIPADDRIADLIILALRERSMTLRGLALHLLGGAELPPAVTMSLYEDLLRTHIDRLCAQGVALCDGDGTYTILERDVVTSVPRTREDAQLRRVDMLPYLSIALSERCNLKCRYCPPYGETYGTPQSVLTLEDVRQILQVAHDLGVKKVRLTGGEPLLYPHIQDVLTFAAAVGLETHVNTNGTLIHQHRRILKETPNLHLKVSLDTLDRETFRELAGEDLLPQTLDGIDDMCDDGKLDRLGTVVTTKNYRHVPALLSFCRERGIGLKLLDMYLVPERRSVWEDLYIPLAVLGLDGEPGARNPYTERYGIPTTERVVSGVNIRLKDSRSGTTYHRVCDECPLWPCQEGFYCLVVTPSKHIVPCRLGRQLQRSFQNSAELAVALSETIRIYQRCSRKNTFWEKHSPLLAAKLSKYGGT